MTFPTTGPVDEKPMLFEILKSTTGELRARLGRLQVHGKKAIDTPHYVGISSRGVVPHLSQDNYQKKTSLRGVYVALEDFIEKASSKKTPPVLSPTRLSSYSPLRDFISLPSDQLLILGARRVPPVVSPWSNSQTAVSIYTSVGFAQLEAADYADAARKLKPDIVVGLGDIPFGLKPGSRRTEKMSGRTEQFMRDMLAGNSSDRAEDSNTPLNLFAPILPIEHSRQTFYLDSLVDEWLPSISGIAIYNATMAIELPELLDQLPKLSLSAPKTPHDVLRETTLGIDIFALSFITTATDAGIALSFRFPAGAEKERKPLGVDMWSTEHDMDVSPLADGCACYACTRHHRAYVRHLLSAKEMLAWVLLQVHNHAVMDAFFEGVRGSIAGGRFEEDVGGFARAYEAEFPEKTGRGPRVRGYQYKSDGPVEGRKNEPAFKRYGEGTKETGEALMPDAGTASAELVGEVVLDGAEKE